MQKRKVVNYFIFPARVENRQINMHQMLLDTSYIRPNRYRFIEGNAYLLVIVVVSLQLTLNDCPTRKDVKFCL